MEQTEEKYEGEMKDGKRHGFGTLILPDGTKYVGEFEDGEYNGSGKLSFPNMDYYEGVFKESKLNGLGKYFYGQDCTMAKYEGELLNGKKHGKGLSIYLFRNHEDIDWYSFMDGSFINDKQNGYGLLIEHIDFTAFKKDERLLDINSESYKKSSSWKKYEGEFQNGEKHGRGMLTKFDKRISNNSSQKFDYHFYKYEGEFVNDQFQGSGMLISASSISASKDNSTTIYYNLFAGDFINGKYNGNGTSFRFGKEGVFENEIHDFIFGVIDEKEFLNRISTNSSIEYCYLYTGAFNNGKYNGKGSKVSFECESFDENEIYDLLFGVIDENKFLTNKEWSKYEGDFLDGKMSGEVTLTDPYRTIFKGLFKSGNKNGLGTYYYSDGKLFTGQFIDDYEHGEGLLQLPNGERYVGYFIKQNSFEPLILTKGSKYVNDAKIRDFLDECAIFETFPINQIYEGEHKEFVKHGKGLLLTNSGDRYYGQFYNGEFQGNGHYEFKQGNIFEGEFEKGLFHGKGTLIFKNGEKYTGDFKNNLFNGYGIYQFPDGRMYIGELVNNKRHGTGTFIYKDGTKYIGDFLNDKICGNGLKVMPNGDKYSGDFLNGLLHGKGTVFYSNGEKYYGEFKFGKKDGNGISIYKDGKQGQYIFKDGELVSGDTTLFFKKTLEEKLSNSSNDRYLFFDTETTGLPLNWNASVKDLNNWPRLVQLAYILFDNNGVEISRDNYIIKPDGFTIPKEASDVHGITNEKALSEGITLIDALQKFYSTANRARFVVAHNIAFDEKIIGAEFIRMGMHNIIEHIPKICTMKKTTDFCAIDGPYGYKWPKLSELHMKLFGEEFEEAHNAASDINATAKCFWKLRKMGVL